MGKSSKKTRSNSTTNRTPYGPASPIINDIVGGAGNLNQIDYRFNPTQLDAMDRVRDFADSDLFGNRAAGIAEGVVNSGLPTGLEELLATARGDRIGGNSQFNPALMNTLDRTADVINSQFSGAGRYGSGAHTGVLSDRLGQISTAAQADQFNRDRTDQLNAAGKLFGTGLDTTFKLPNLERAGLFGAELLGQMGDQQQRNDILKQLAPHELLQQQSGLTFPIASRFGTDNVNSVSKTTTNPSLGSQVLGGLTTAASLLAAPATGGLSLFGTGLGGGMLSGLNDSIMPGGPAGSF